MSNHARGLWGYSGRTPAGDELTIQSTGMGGPSAAAVLTDLAKLGVRRAVRVGTCTAIDGEPALAELIVVDAARAEGGEAELPDPALTARLQHELTGVARLGTVASFDAMPARSVTVVEGVAVADMQTATVLACGRALGIAAAAVLIVATTASGARVEDEALALAAKRAGSAAATALSP